MTFLFPTLSVAFAAFCVWLTVRVVNRRERWAKWTAIAAIATVAFYLGGYFTVRATHTKRWFDKSTGETGSFTFFDTWSWMDTLLYRAYYRHSSLTGYSSDEISIETNGDVAR